MTRTITPRRSQPGVSKALQLAHQYLFNRWQAADAKKLQEKVYVSSKADKSELLDFIKAKGEVDEAGSYTWTFPDPLHIGTEEITGLKYRRGETPSSIDTDAVQAYAKENDLEYILSSARFEVEGLSSEALTAIAKFIDRQVKTARKIPGAGEVMEPTCQTSQVWDYEKLYVLNQQGLIPDDVLTKFLVEHPEDAPYSLVVEKNLWITPTRCPVPG
jgi:hypothetical protein